MLPVSHAQVGRQRDSDGKVSVKALAFIGAISLLAVSSACTVSSTAARMTFSAPGFELGPVVLGGGLLWSGERGVSLTDPAGTHLIAPGFVLPEVLVGGGWTVATDERRVRAGPTGGHLASIPALQQCVTESTMRGSSLAALTRQSLYMVVTPRCVGREPKQEREPNEEGEPKEEQLLARVRLGSKRLQVLARLGTGAISLAAAGRRIAVTYLVGRVFGPRRARLRVHVLDSRSGRVLYRLSRPSSEARPALVQRATTPRLRKARIVRYFKTQLDVEGDVLVGAGLRSQRWSWWGNARTRAAALSPEQAGGTLSAGHIAYATNRGGLEHIDVLNLASGKVRTEVVLRGSAHIEGVGLLGTRLAWAQQSHGYRIRERFLPRVPCVEFGRLGDTQLVETSLSAAGPAEVVETPPAPARPTGPSCPVPKVAI
jgi:hypothetical protein